MLIPNKYIDRHSEKLVHHAGDGERGGGNGPPGREPEETNEQAEEARQGDGVEGGGVEKAAGSNRGDNLDVLAGDEGEKGSHHKREEVVVEDEAPCVEAEAHDHVLDVDHLGGDGDEVGEGPGVGGEGEGGVGGDVAEGAGEDDEEGEEGEVGGAGLAAEDGVGEGDEERGEGSEDDEGVDVGMAEKIGVGEDGEVEDEGGGEEFFGGGEGEGVVVEKP